MSYRIIIQNVVGVEMIIKALREYAHGNPDPAKRIAHLDLADGIEKRTIYLDDATGDQTTLAELAAKTEQLEPAMAWPALTIVK